MVVASGHIKNGHPVIPLHLSRGLREREVLRPALLDTGFTGTLLVPARTIVRLGIFVEGTTSISLADNSSKQAWLAPAYVRCGNIQHRCDVLIEPDCNELIVGMDFLRLFNLSLFLSPTAVILLDQNASVFDALLSAPRRRLLRTRR